MNTLIITLGTRDIQLKTEDFTHTNIPPQILEEYTQLKKETNSNKSIYNIPARVLGEFLYRYFSFFLDYIDFPIVTPTLKMVEQEGITLDNVVLVATDQYEKHNQDTVYFGMVLEKFLIKKYPNVKVYHLPVHENVISLHDMYDFMLEKLSTSPFKEKIFESENLYLHLVGGIDAINNAVRFVVLHLYSQDKSLVEVMVDEKRKQSFKIDIKTRFYTVLEYKFARRFVEKYNYAAILELHSIDIKIRTLAEYAHNRLIFQPEKAIQTLENNQKHFPKSEDSFIELLINDVKDLDKEKFTMRQLYYSCFIKFQQGDYDDFLLRIFRFIEMLQLQEVINITGINYPEQNDWKQEFEKYLNDKENQRIDKEDLKLYLEKKEIRYLEDNPTTYLTENLLNYFIEHDKELENSPEFKQKMNFKNYVKDLKSLRNESIAAHGVDSFSHTTIIKKLKKAKKKIYPDNIDEINLLFREFRKILKIEEDIYEKLNHKIIEYIDTGITKARESRFVTKY